MIISNVLFKFDEAHSNQPTVAMFWSATLKLINFTIIGSSGTNVFYIQYQSKVSFENIEISNFSCLNREKGCILSSLSNSTTTVTNVSIKNLKSISSLIHIDNSSFSGSIFDFKTISNIGSDDVYIFTLLLAKLFLYEADFTFFSGGFLYADQSFIQIQALNLKDNVFSSNLVVSALFLSNCIMLSINGSIFENIKSPYYGGVY